MQAYEFYTKPKNGVIPIPEQYKNKIVGNIMVIVLEKENHSIVRKEVNNQKKTDLLSPPTLDTRGWKFDREEANER